jgi:hypothetical protein
MLSQQTSETIVETHLLAKSHFELRRMHINIYVMRRHGEKKKGHRMTITGQQRPVGFVERVAQGPILHGPTVHKKALLRARPTVEGWPGNEPMDLQALIGILYGQQMFPQALAKYYLKALPEIRGGKRSGVDTAIHGQRHMHVWCSQS